MRAANKPKATPESIVLSEITAALTRLGYPLASSGRPGHTIRMSVGPVLKAGGRIAKNPLKGFPDLLVFLKNGGGALAIEVKRKDGGILSPEQKLWLKLLSGCGVICVVARSAAYVESLIKRIESKGENTSVENH